MSSAYDQTSGILLTGPVSTILEFYSHIGDQSVQTISCTETVTRWLSVVINTK